VALLSILMVKAFAVIVGFPCMTIMLTNSATSLRILGTLNGFATAFSGIGRAVGPAVTGAAFSWGVSIGYVIPSWWLLALIAAVGAIPSWFIVDGDGPTAGLASSSSSDDGEDGEEDEDEEPRILQDSAVVFESDDEDLDTAELEEQAETPLLWNGSGQTKRYDTNSNARQ
jgi:hypothetical protein